jgi:hypothetical protein
VTAHPSASTEVINDETIPPHLHTPSWRDAELMKPRDNFTFAYIHIVTI